MSIDIYKQEVEMWEAARNKDREKFLDLVREDAIMVCGGFRCTGKEYAEIIAEFDCKSFEINHFEIVNESVDSIQIHYVISLEVNDVKNADLAGKFHITTTWKCEDDKWKVVFNMDQRIYE